METLQAFRLLDIHTHKVKTGQQGRAIVSFSLQEIMPVSFNFRSFQPDVSNLLPGNLQKTDDWWISVGIHPWYIAEDTWEQQIEFLTQLLPDGHIVAIGEGGLDRFSTVPMSIQLRVFEAQVGLSEQHQLPLVIHCVKAVDELLAVRKRLRPQQPWIWHGFRGKPEQAVQLLKQGIYLSFGEHYAVEALRKIPAHRLFLETDESQLDIEDLLQRAAEVRGVEKEELRAALMQNVRYIFFKA